MLTLANAGAVNSTINFADGAGLTTALNTAYTINDADKLVNDAVNNAAGRLTLGSVGTGASLTISDAFTYTQAGLDAIASAYDSVTVNVDNASKASAISAFNKTGLTWGADNVTAALFIGAPTTVFGSINVDGIMTADTGATYGTSGLVSIQNHGLLMVDQTSVDSSAAINGSLTLASGSYVAIANADAGSVILATEVADDGATVVTDNPFLEGAINGNSVDVSVSPTGGLGVLASTGIQAMIPPCGYGARSDDRRPYVPRSGTRCRHEPLG